MTARAGWTTWRWSTRWVVGDDDDDIDEYYQIDLVDVDDNMKLDLQKGVKTCTKLSQCLPPEEYEVVIV